MKSIYRTVASIMEKNEKPVPAVKPVKAPASAPALPSGVMAPAAKPAAKPADTSGPYNKRQFDTDNANGNGGLLGKAMAYINGKSSNAGAGQSSKEFAASDPRRLDKGDGGEAAMAGQQASLERNQVKAKPQAAIVKPAVAKPAAAPAPTGSESTRPNIDKEKSDIISKAMSAKPEEKPAPPSVIDAIKAKQDTPSAAPSVDQQAKQGAQATGMTAGPDHVKVTNDLAATDKPVNIVGHQGQSTVNIGHDDQNKGGQVAAAKPIPQAAMTAQSDDGVVKDRQKDAVKSGDGSAVTTRSANTIGDTNRAGQVVPGSFDKNRENGDNNLKGVKRWLGVKESTINKKFNITDALYQSVMEVMKKDKKEGSVPRNDKEKDLAAAYGDPKRITHGDVLKMRGVTKEEVDQIDELSKSTLGSYVKKSSLNRSQLSYGSGLAASRGVTDTKGIEKDSQRAKGISKAVGRLTGEEVEEFDEALVGNQRNIDANKNNKIDAHDFKLLRAKKKPVEEGVASAAKSMAKKVLSKLGGGSDEDQLKDLQKKMGTPQTGKKPMKEGKDTPGNSYEHQCAVHVKSESFGEGRTITTQHADPDASGNIAWYDVMFEHGIEKQVPTDTLEILVSESHMMHKKKKAM